MAILPSGGPPTARALSSVATRFSMLGNRAEAVAAGGAAPCHVKHHCPSIPTAPHHAHRLQVTDALVRDMTACAWCGRVALGADEALLRTHWASRLSDTCPPGVLANPILLPLAMAESITHNDHPGPWWWWCCQTCVGDPPDRQQRVGTRQIPISEWACDEARMQDITRWRSMLHRFLHLPPSAPLQLGVLCCRVRFAHRIHGFLHLLSAADQRRPPLLRGPIVAWDEGADGAADGHALSRDLDALVAYLAESNPAVQRFLTMAERLWSDDADQHTEATAVPVLGSEAVAPAIAGPRTRDPRTRPVPYTVTAAMDWDDLHSLERTTAATLYRLGDVVPRPTSDDDDDTVQPRTRQQPRPIFGDHHGWSTTCPWTRACFPSCMRADWAATGQAMTCTPYSNIASNNSGRRSPYARNTCWSCFR